MIKKARSWSCAFFVALLFSSACPASCPPDRIEEQATVRYVNDGDTVVLTDGRRIRLIGINTPELSHDNRPAEPGATQARNDLLDLLDQSHRRIGLRVGAEARDRYGRTLAHAFLPDGTNLTAALLSRGSGFLVTIPPNTWQSDCYRRQAEAAHTSRLGVWRLPGWRPKSSYNLPADTRGFQRIIGVLEDIGESRNALWLNLSGGFAVHIAREDLHYFAGVNWNEWLNKRVEVTGWVYASHDRLRMNMHHPNMIKRLN